MVRGSKGSGERRRWVHGPRSFRAWHPDKSTRPGRADSAPGACAEELRPECDKNQEGGDAASPGEENEVDSDVLMKCLEG